MFHPDLIISEGVLRQKTTTSNLLFHAGWLQGFRAQHGGSFWSVTHHLSSWRRGGEGPHPFSFLVSCPRQQMVGMLPWPRGLVIPDLRSTARFPFPSAVPSDPVCWFPGESKQHNCQLVDYHLNKIFWLRRQMCLCVCVCLNPDFLGLLVTLRMQLTRSKSRCQTPS